MFYGIDWVKLGRAILAKLGDETITAAAQRMALHASTLSRVTRGQACDARFFLHVCSQLKLRPFDYYFCKKEPK